MCSKIFATLLIIGIGFFFIIFRGATSHYSSSQIMKGSDYNAGAIVLAIYQGNWAFGGFTTLNYGSEEIEIKNFQKWSRVHLHLKSTFLQDTAASLPRRTHNLRRDLCSRERLLLCYSDTSGNHRFFSSGNGESTKSQLCTTCFVADIHSKNRGKWPSFCSARSRRVPAHWHIEWWCIQLEQVSLGIGIHLNTDLVQVHGRRVAAEDDAHLLQFDPCWQRQSSSVRLLSRTRNESNFKSCTVSDSDLDHLRLHGRHRPAGELSDRDRHDDYYHCFGGACYHQMEGTTGCSWPCEVQHLLASSEHRHQRCSASDSHSAGSHLIYHRVLHVLRRCW